MIFEINFGYENMIGIYLGNITDHFLFQSTFVNLSEQKSFTLFLLKGSECKFDRFYRRWGISWSTSS